MKTWHLSQASPCGDTLGRVGVCDGLWGFGHNQGQALCLVALLVVGIVDVTTRETLQLSQVYTTLCGATCWGLMRGCVWGSLSPVGRGWSRGSADAGRAEVGAVGVITPSLITL